MRLHQLRKLRERRHFVAGRFLVGIDQHKRIRDSRRRQQYRKEHAALRRGYFQTMLGSHRAVVESTSGWYWMNDLLQQEGIELKRAQATYLKAISYAKVKTDKVDALTLAQLIDTTGIDRYGSLNGQPPVSTLGLTVDKVMRHDTKGCVHISTCSPVVPSLS